ncbi:MAG TPA: beta-ketoacyl synthase N-terminal-like domain-containing protein [Pseudonocardiaceae bacterium]|nr:beta-ketoacyl synthase N-terminal-like domain-containing protein [Pseudonocardiaceae bacterium]
MMHVAVVGTGVAARVLTSPGDVLGQPVDPTARFDPATLLGGRGLRYKDRATRLGLLAANRALADAGLLDATGTTVPAASVGVVVSSNLGNLDTVCRTAGAIATGSVTDAAPMDLPNASSNVVASSIAIRFGLRGPNVMVCNGPSSGLDAAFLAASLILACRVPRVVLVGVEPVNDVVEHLADDPAGDLFDGAAAAVLESETSATARGAVPLARLGGYARRTTTDASVDRALGAGPPPGLWFAGRATAAPPAVADVCRKDLEAELGAASGALGVLQVVAGTCWLGAEAGPALATAGDPADGVSSLLLTTAGAAA